MRTWTTSLKRVAKAVAPLAVGALALSIGLAKPQHARADGEAEAAEKRERCATRVSVALLGKSATPELMASANPQDAVDTILKDPQFIDRFARFVNSQFNPEPGEEIADDASYTLAKFILTDGTKPWKDMFVGQYNVADAVTPDPNGLGYFRSAAWMKRYAGNEKDGYRISAGYRMLQNTTGLKLTATTNVEGVDLSADGRKAPACAGCHYNGWFALDLVSKVLSKRKGTGDNITYLPPTEGPQTILSGKTIASDKDLVEALVASENFRFNACRLGFEFLYGRPESTCEGQVFDKCVDAFTQTGTIQAALSAIAKDASFCQ